MRRRARSLLGALLAALFCACQRDAPLSLRLADGSPPNILLITVDTLRADHLGCLNPAAGGLTPNIDRLAADSIVFERASTPVAATLPALASLLSGRYPGGQPVRTNNARLPPDVPVLAEILRAAGYRTAAYYGNSLLSPSSGFDRGFLGYTSFVSFGGASDAGGADLASGWLAMGVSQPWFLWLHFMDPHGPYDSAPVSLSDDLVDDGRSDARLPLSPTNYGLGVIPKYQQLAGLDRASAYRRRYGGEIRFTDAQIGRVLATLEETGLRERTLIVLSADHGESLGEHDYYFQHGWFPYEESVHVPLILRLPGKSAPRRVGTPVSLVDLVPSLLAGLGLAAPDGIDGRDLRPAMTGGELAVAPVFSVTAYLNQMTSMRLGRWKLVHTPKPPETLAGDPWASYYARQESFALYDLASDPGETRDLSSTEAPRTEDMRRQLSQWERVHGIPMGRPAAAELDPATRERMKALGYAS